MAADPAVVEDQLFHIDDQLITIDENLEEITDEFLHLDEQGGAQRSTFDIYPHSAWIPLCKSSSHFRTLK